MNRKNFYAGQPVTEAELDSAFDDCESGINALLPALGVSGILSGLAVSAPGGIAVTIGLGKASDAAGQLITVPSNAVSLSLATATGGASTAVAGSGNERIVSLFLKFARATSDSRVDGNGNVVQFENDESFSWVIRVGAEATAGAAVAPALEADGVLICDVTRTFGQVNIISGNISTTRRQVFLPAKAWANALAIPEGSIKTRLDGIVDSLASTSQGSALIGSAFVGTGVGAGTLFSQLQALFSSTGHKSFAQTWTSQNTFNASTTPTVPSSDEALPSLITTTRPQSTGYKLLWESAADETGTVKVRLYSGKGSLTLSGFSISINGSYFGTNWTADTTAQPITVFSLTSAGIRMRQAAAGVSPKGDFTTWTVNMLLDTNGQIDAGDQGVQNCYTFLRFLSSAGSDVEGTHINFRRRFTNPPTSFTPTVVGTDINAGTLSFVDATRDGVGVVITPSAPNTLTKMARTVVVAP